MMFIGFLIGCFFTAALFFACEFITDNFDNFKLD